MSKTEILQEALVWSIAIVITSLVAFVVGFLFGWTILEIYKLIS